MKSELPVAGIAVPVWLRNHVLEVNVIVFEGDHLPYLIVSKELEARLPGFVASTGDLFFISEEVPVPFRKFFLIHEIIEFRKHNDEQGRCKCALLAELALVPEEMRESYVIYRREFFRRLVSYYEDLSNGGTAEFLGEVKASLAHLESLK